jgi:hypothetical protein
VSVAFQAYNVFSVFPGENKQTGFITLGYRGTFAFGRDGLSDVKFRKLARIIVCGRVALCREVRGPNNLFFTPY